MKEPHGELSACDPDQKAAPAGPMSMIRHDISTKRLGACLRPGSSLAFNQAAAKGNEKTLPEGV